ncbi:MULTISPECIES: hypothetical protein [Streptomyces]|uniref:hypothetical protein n=1 Tax=Streptomyces TaxID=1883 RepID=UPI0037F95A8D
MIETAEEFIRLRFSGVAGERDRAVREEAATGVWGEILRRYPDARMWVAQNKTVPIEVLEVLAGDVDPQVRTMVAMKRKLSPAILRRLAGDVDDSVRLAVARHRKTPCDILEHLQNDEWEEVREVAEERLRNVG